MMQHSVEMIREGRLHFVFIHLPVPHPPGIYSRRTGQLCLCGDYLDNLALADVTLGELRKEIDATPWASQTTLIVSSDHSWRVPLWKYQPGWTAEEEHISNGHFEPKPVFEVHFPNEKTGVVVDAQFPEMREHDVIASMLDGKLPGAPEELGVIRSFRLAVIFALGDA